MDRRDIVLGAAATGMLGATGALAGGPMSGEAVRLGPDRVRLTVSAGTEAVVLVCADPAGKRILQGPQRIGAGGGARDFALAHSPRPYFLLGSGGQVRLRLAERLLPLEGIRNFRDLGGYRTLDGREVRWGRIYRSGHLDHPTAADAAYVAQLGLGTICDLRSSQERRVEPGRRAAAAVTVRATDYDYAALPALTSLPANRAEAVAGFADSYAEYARFLAPQLGELFDALATEAGPVAFNCTLGKDRTGMAAALILSVLGVPRSAIVADYALTERYAPPAPQGAGPAERRDGGSHVLADEARRLAALPPDVYQVLLGSDPAVMVQALSLVDQRYGGPLALAKALMGVGEAQVEHLRRRLLV